VTAGVRRRSKLVPVPPRLARFADLVQRRPEDVPLAEASLEIARDEYPELDVAAYLKRIDHLEAAAASADPGPGGPARKRLMVLNRVLFNEAGFTDSDDPQDDPKNSYLNEVLDRHTGLPVVLSVLYLEIGQRLGLDLVGVGMPGHFIVRLMGEDPALFIDPFHKGAFLTEEGCRKLLHEVSDGRLEIQPEYLLPWSSHRILDRILHNLKAVYIQHQDYRRARKVLDYILVLRPSKVSELRDRGLLAYQALLFEQAVADLERYLELTPNSKDAAPIRVQVQSLRRLLPSMN